MAYAGLDVGTSGCKLVVYHPDGRQICSFSRRYKESGTGGCRELDPLMVKEQVFSVLLQAGRECPEPIQALAVASMGETVVCLNEQDQPLMGAMLTGDCRGIEQTRRLVQEEGALSIFKITGLPPNELYSLPKWMWIREETDVLDKTRKMLFFEDYVGYLLTGERKVSYSSAARSLCFDISQKKWSARLLKKAGIQEEWLSQPVPPFSVVGQILPEIAVQLGLPKDLLVAAGGHDQTCAAFGSGLTKMETAECGMGTCEFMFVMLPGRMITEDMLANDFTCIPYVFPDTYLTSIEVTTCGILKNWARDALFAGIRDEDGDCIDGPASFFARMDEKAGRVETEVLVLPQFGSAGNPDLSMDARGTITGLTIHTTPEQIYRGILEGMAFQSYLSYERMKEMGVRPQVITATGGGAASALTLQIRADVFGMPVRVPETMESGTLGCMMMAAVADGTYPDAATAVAKAVRYGKEYQPDLTRHEAYLRKFEKYREFYARMHAWPA